MANTASTNIDFLRWKHGTHKSLHEKIKKIMNWKTLSDIALGKSDIHLVDSILIEDALNLPRGWIFRDNMAFTELDEDDHDLVSTVLSLKNEAKEALAAFLHATKIDKTFSTNTTTGHNAEE